ncbi:hypothetical protein Tco_0237396 [Tanacetum coccineum]
MTDTETSSFESPLKVDKDWKEKFFYPANHVESVNQIEKPVKRTVRYADKSLVKEQESQPEKKTVIPTAAKIEKPVRKPVKYAEMYSAHKHMAPRAVLMKTGLKSFNTARPVNTVRSVNTGRPFSTARHMTGNIAHLSDFEGGYVTFGREAYGGRITGKTVTYTLASPKQTAIGKDYSNPFMAGSLPKTIHWAGKARKRARVVLSEDEEDDSSKQGRKISNIDEDLNTYFAQDDEVVHDQDTAKEGQPEDSTAGITVSTAPINISTARETRSTAGRVVYGRRSKEARKDKGKAIMTEPKPEKKSKKLLEQERLEIARQLLALDEERATSEPKTTKDIDWNDPSVQKYWDLKNKPKSEAQARKNMIVYLKNQSNYKMKDFEGMSYDEIRPIFEKVWDFNHNFVPMDLEIEKEKKKPAEFQEIEEEQIEKDTSKKTTGKRKKYLPRRRTRSTAKKQKVEQDDEKEELKNYLDIVPREDVAVDVESLSTKYPIVDWKTYTLSENFMYYKIIRGDGSSKNYKILSEMLYDFDRQDVVELYRLVKERYSSSKPEGYDLMLWGDLHTLFEPDEESEIWMNQNEYNLISWSLCDFCGVHILLMQNGIAIHMLTEKKYPLSQEMISKMLSKRLEVDQESTQAYELLRIDQGLGSTSGIRACALRNFDLEVMELENTQNNALAKLPMLKLGDFQIQDYALWEVIENGYSWVPIPVTTPPESGTSTTTKMTVPATIEEKTCNEATKKTQKALLKQQYENFSASSSKSLDSIFNRLQKLVSRSAILGVVTPPKDLNKVKKFAGASNNDKNLAFVTTSGEP